MSTLWKWQEVVCGLLMAAAGVVLLMIPELTTLLIAQAAAGVLGAAGLVFIIVYFIRRRSSVVGYDLVKAAVLIAAGILVYLHAKEVSSVIFMAFGILILICGILIAQRSIDLRHFGGSSWILFLMIALLGIIDAVLVILNPFAAASRWLLWLISGGLVFTGGFLVISAFVVGHRVSRFLEEKENAVHEYVQAHHKPAKEEPVYKPQDPVYKPQEPVYEEPAYEETAPQIPEERPVETDLPTETDLPAETELPTEEDSTESGFRGFFKRKKS